VKAEDLDTVHDAGLKCFVSDPAIKIRGKGKDGGEAMSDEQINAAVKDLVARTANHPATFGYHVIDEPALKLVPLVSRWAKAIGEAAQKPSCTPIFSPSAPVTSGLAALIMRNI